MSNWDYEPDFPWLVLIIFVCIVLGIILSYVE